MNQILMASISNCIIINFLSGFFIAYSTCLFVVTNILFDFALPERFGKKTKSWLLKVENLTNTLVLKCPLPFYSKLNPVCSYS